MNLILEVKIKVESKSVEKLNNLDLIIIFI